MIEKRKVERFELSLLVKLNVAGSIFDNLYTQDISSSGMFVVTGIPTILKTKVGIEVSMPLAEGIKSNQRNMISATGEVVRTEKRGWAIQFNQKCKILN